jgi:peptidoglycan/xylan/chitin deacetylase (PgdA/CDA1 family)
MKTNLLQPILIPLKGKGLAALLKRGWRILQSYGLGPGLMDKTLAQFVAALHAPATFPITASALARNSGVIAKYQQQGIEFAIHGYRHIDHAQLSPSEQEAQLHQAITIFEQAGVACRGWRCPYLRWNEATLHALRHAHLAYDSSQALYWDVVGELETPAYRRVLEFYRAEPAARYPSLPELQEGLVRLPYSIPDDESLVDRLRLADSPAMMTRLWQAILKQSYDLGELFVLGLHPERFKLCRVPLLETLRQARALSPAVWITRLDQVSDWWRARTAATATLTATGPYQFRVTVGDGPPGLTVLARNVAINGPVQAWGPDYQRVEATDFTLTATTKPVIGLSPGTASALADFLRQQGYILETSTDAGTYSFYLDRPDFSPQEQRPLLADIEGGRSPLVRLARWPRGARSALVVSGDIDALTIWDYTLRMRER